MDDLYDNHPAFYRLYTCYLCENVIWGGEYKIDMEVVKYLGIPAQILLIYQVPGPQSHSLNSLSSEWARPIESKDDLKR